MGARRKTDDERSKDLLLWARKQRIAVQRITVGDVSIDLVDYRLAESEGPVVRSEREAKRTIYNEFAGPLAGDAGLVEKEDENAVIEDDDE